MKNNKDFSKYEQNLKKVLLTTDLIYNKLTNKNLIKTIEDYSINVKSSFPDEDGFAELVTDSVNCECEAWILNGFQCDKEGVKEQVPVFRAESATLSSSSDGSKT